MDRSDDRKNGTDWAVIGTDYGHWHETIREASVAPLLEKQVSLDELELFTAGG